MYLDKREMKPDITFIIPMKNTENYIGKCLQSILSVNYDKNKIEIIVIDNNSSDKSVEIACKYPVEIKKCPLNTIGKVRNFGANMANGSIFAFIDSDCAIYNDWIKNAIEILRNPRIAVVGNNYELPNDPNWIERAWLYENKSEYREVTFVPGGNFAIKSDVFREVGGFDEALVTCEDADICERVGKKGYLAIKTSKMKSIHMRNPQNIKEFINKEIWYGIDMLSSVKNKQFDKVLIVTMFFYVSHLSLLIGILSSKYIAMCSFIVILLLINMSIIYRIYYSKKYIEYFRIGLLYYSYFMARGIGLIKGILNLNNI